MYTMKIAITSLVSSFAAIASASPLDTTLVVSPLANVAVVNMYSDASCGGTVQSFTVTGGTACQAVNGDKASILVSENNCATYTWSGTNCEGSSAHISGSTCTAVLYGSVSVDCT